MGDLVSVDRSTDTLLQCQVPLKAGPRVTVSQRTRVLVP
ncbi:MAG: hypothetical protein ACJARY_001690 [Candidatus Azotimanducaceae bacterium]|jgi:hypothetical protein